MDTISISLGSKKASSEKGKKTSEAKAAKQSTKPEVKRTEAKRQAEDAQRVVDEYDESAEGVGEDRKQNTKRSPLKGSKGAVNRIGVDGAHVKVKTISVDGEESGDEEGNAPARLYWCVVVLFHSESLNCVDAQMTRSKSMGR